jgi:hypothetical protein
MKTIEPSSDEPSPELAPPTPADMARFADLFQGRGDVVARFWRSRNGERSGFAPICRNEWGSACRKGRFPNPCRDCGHAAYAPMTRTLLRDHFRGRHLLGVYPLRPDGTCRFLAADFDVRSPEARPLADARALAEVCAVLELPLLLLRSRSGRGCHAFLFFDAPVPARLARRLGHALLEEAGLRTEGGSFDRFFPAQDRPAGRGPGNLIALPFHGGAARRGHTLPLDPDSGYRLPRPDPWAFLADQRTMAAGRVSSLLVEWRLLSAFSPDDDAGPPIPDSRFRRPAGVVSSPPRAAHRIEHGAEHRTEHRGWPPADFERIAARCRFIAHCRDDAASLPEPDWYILLTIAARCRDGRRLAHRLSAPYPRYRAAETEAKIQRALTCTGPYRCRTIARIDGRFCGSCPHAGRLSSPIRLGYDSPPSAPGGFSAGESIPRYLAFPASEIFRRKPDIPFLPRPRAS